MTTPSTILQFAFPISFQLSMLLPSKSTIQPGSEDEDMDEQPPSATAASPMTSSASFLMMISSLVGCCRDFRAFFSACQYSGSLDANVPFLDDLAPFLRFSPELRGEFLGRARDDLEAHLLEESRLLRSSQCLPDPRVAQRDDLRRRTLGREHTVPGHELVTGQSRLGDGRHVGERRRALGAAHPEHDELAGLCVGNRL